MSQYNKRIVMRQHFSHEKTFYFKFSLRGVDHLPVKDILIGDVYRITLFCLQAYLIMFHKYFIKLYYFIYLGIFWRCKISKKFKIKWRYVPPYRSLSSPLYSR